MARELNGKELADFIKERQAKQVRALRQAHKVIPKLAIVMTPKANQAIGVYVKYKRIYAQDILIETAVEVCEQAEMPALIKRLNNDASVQGIIVQLPLDDASKTDEIVNMIEPAKDVDGLGVEASYPSATAEAINWLCGGYNVPLDMAKITVVGQGRLVGGPLTKMWKNSGYSVMTVDINTPNANEIISSSDVVVTAVGKPGLITSAHIKQNAFVIDAGTTSENGTVVGDVADDVRERTDISITPVKGGVGPLTIALLYDHLIQACQKLRS